MTATAFRASESVASCPTSYTPSTFATPGMDTSGFWSAGVPTRATIPRNGWYLLHAHVGGDANTRYQCRFKINGTTTTAVSGQGAGGNTSTENLDVLYLFAGDYVELEWLCGASAKSSGNTLQIIRLPTPLFVGDSVTGGGGVLMPLTRKAGPKNDPANWWTSTASTRVTVDTTGTYLVVAQCGSNNSDVWYYVRKNGTIIHEGHGQINSLTSASPCGLTFVSVHALTAGDYLQIETSIGAEVNTFAVARIDGVKAAMAKTTTGTTEGSFASQPTTQTFNAEEVDTDGFHDNATNNHRVTIPSGKAGNYWAFMDLSIQSTNILGLAKNGTGVIGTDRTGSPDIGANNNRWTHGCASWVDALAVGDYFHSYAYTNPGNTSDPLGTFLGLVCMDDFVYEPDAWVPQVYRVKRP